MANQPIFDIRVPVKRRNILRLIIVPLVSIGFILWGIYLLPEDASFQLKAESIPTWSVWWFLGLILIGIGIFKLIKEAIFAYQSLGTSGEWHFCLVDNHLIWDTPDHAHGRETGFRTNLSDLKEIEYRTIERFESIDREEYWFHFWNRESIQIQGYSGVSMSWLVSQICSEGVKYNETFIGE